MVMHVIVILVRLHGNIQQHANRGMSDDAVASA